jgi:hypothetical protein
MSNTDFEIADLQAEPGKANTKTQQFIFVLAENKPEADAIASDKGFGECNELVNGKPPQFSRTWKEMAGAQVRNLGNYVFGGAAKPVVIIATVAGQPDDRTLTYDEPIKRAKEATGSAGTVPSKTTETGQLPLAQPVITVQHIHSGGSPVGSEEHDEQQLSYAAAVQYSGSGTHHVAIKKKRSNNTTDPATIQVLTGVRWDTANEPTEATAELPIEYTVIEATRAGQYAIIMQTMEMKHMVRRLNAQFVPTNASPAAAQPYVELVRDSYGNTVPPITIDGSSSTADMVYTTRTGNAVIFPGPDNRYWRAKMNCTTVYAGKPKKNMLARVVGYTDALVRDTTRRFVCSTQRAGLSPAESDRHRLLLFCTLVYTGWGKYQSAATVEDRGDGFSGSLTCTVGGTVGKEDDSEPEGSQFTSGTVFQFTLESGKRNHTTFNYEIIDAHAATSVHPATAQAPGAAVSLHVAPAKAKPALAPVVA